MNFCDINYVSCSDMHLRETTDVCRPTLVAKLVKSAAQTARFTRVKQRIPIRGATKGPNPQTISPNLFIWNRVLYFAIWAFVRRCLGRSAHIKNKRPQLN